MVILGLGSNLGDRLENLRHALRLIMQIPDVTVKHVSPVYLSDAQLPANAPHSWDMPHLNVAISCATTLNPIVLLQHLKKIEISIGRNAQTERWSPRIIDIDILVWDDVVIDTDNLSIPHKRLLDRPFALWPLADIAPLWKWKNQTAAQMAEHFGSRFSGEAPYRTRQLYQRIDTPALVGIINVTPDSFADGGEFLNPDKALQQAESLVKAGATVLDIGAESTSPMATAITAEEEWLRLKPVLEGIHFIKNSFLLPPKISIDTRHPETAIKVLDFGVDWLNDQTGLDNPWMREIVASSHVDCIIMHHLSIPERRDNVLPRNQDPVAAVYAWGEKRIHELEKRGIPKERIIFDPGIGFGKMAEQSLVVLQNISTFAKLGTRILVGHSRKSYLSFFTDKAFADRDIETTSISMFLANQPIDYLRLHNVEMCSRAFRVAAFFNKPH